MLCSQLALLMSVSLEIETLMKILAYNGVHLMFIKDNTWMQIGHRFLFL